MKMRRHAAFGLIAFAMLAMVGADAPAGVASEAGLWTTASLVAFLTLAALEIVLGIDNVIFIAILAGKLPPGQRDKARVLGLSLAVVTRIMLLLVIGWVISLEETKLLALFGAELSVKDFVLLGGGLFLIGKATYEIHHKLEHAEEEGGETGVKRVATSLRTVLIQILLVDVVFSLDSVITAVGMTNQLPVMIAAILVSLAVMLAFSKPIVTFVDRHPTVKILALAFLILIGTLLVAEGFHQKINKGYVYFAMAFAVAVEMVQLRYTTRRKRLREAAAA